jgi:hypothetical protein
MAIEDKSLYNEWGTAFDRLQAIRLRYDAAKSMWPENHIVVERVKKSLDQAQRHYDDVCSKLTQQECR